MNYYDFLEEVVRQGIAASADSYADDRPKREGAAAGFEACRRKSPEELRLLLVTALQTRERLVGTDDLDAYWWHTCYAAEVEWTCNVVSAVLANMRLPTIVTPTARGYLAASRIVGVTSLSAIPS